jgi:hypothetical protein
MKYIVSDIMMYIYQNVNIVFMHEDKSEHVCLRKCMCMHMHMCMTYSYL